jgi:hypothetical protein
MQGQPSGPVYPAAPSSGCVVVVVGSGEVEEVVGSGVVVVGSGVVVLGVGVASGVVVVADSGQTHSPCVTLSTQLDTLPYVAMP